MAESDEDRDQALDTLLALQQEHFVGLFKSMRGLPVTIRLLDPPLHEFIPNAEDLAQRVERARIEESSELEELEHTLARVHELTETNPMLGTRGVRLAVLQPDVYDMQMRAIIRAAIAVRDETGEAPILEIMVPLITYEQELELMRERLERVAAEEEDATGIELSIGTMIELPRACFVADRIARHADFFSFGTNDLTQTSLGFSRDDVGGMLARYLELNIVDRNPFETIDSPGVGWLVRLASWVGREAKPDLKLGICGEHGGDAESIALFQLAGLDYVSCSPYRVPIARVAAAQAAIADDGQ
jgi:pyruvate,orthophosphate dikinase